MTFKSMGSAAVKASKSRYAEKYERAQARQELREQMIRDGYTRVIPPREGGAEWNKGDEWLNSDGQPVPAPPTASAAEQRAGDMLRERAIQAINAADMGLALYVLCHKSGLTLERVTEALSGGDDTGMILRLFDKQQLSHYLKAIGIDREVKDRDEMIKMIDIAHRSAGETTDAVQAERPKRRGRPPKHAAEAD